MKEPPARRPGKASVHSCRGRTRSQAKMAPTLEELLKTCPRLSRTDLEYLQDWMSKQPHLPRLDDVDLVPMLNRCDYSLERTKELLDKYLTMRTHAPEVFKYRDPSLPEIQEQIKLFHAARLGEDAQGRVVVCTGWNETAPAQLAAFDPEVCAFIAFALMETAVRAAPTGPDFVLVMDASNLTTTHITKPSISLIKKVLAYVQDAVPARIVAVHVIRLNPVVDKVMMLVKPFLSKETQEKLHFHSKSLDSFYEAVPKSMLPQDYGGEQPHSSHFHKALLEELAASDDWVRALDLRVVDERKRPGRPRAEGDVFGVSGSFKRLDFD